MILYSLWARMLLSRSVASSVFPYSFRFLLFGEDTVRADLFALSCLLGACLPVCASRPTRLGPVFWFFKAPCRAFVGRLWLAAYRGRRSYLLTRVFLVSSLLLSSARLFWRFCRSFFSSPMCLIHWSSVRIVPHLSHLICGCSPLPFR
jgi:hypothetical protein